MPPKRRAKPISVVETRRLYEQTNLPVDHIAAMHGISRHALYRRIHMWKWRMRRPLVTLTDPPREPDAVAEILRKLTPEAIDERERAHRMLAHLARTTQEITRLHLPTAAQTGQDANDRGPADTADFVRDIIRRMDEFARRRKAAVPDEPDGTVS